MNDFNEIIYREASLKDLDLIVSMKLTMFVESGHSDLLVRNAKSIILDDYKKLYKIKEAKHFVAIRNNKIISCVGAFIKSDIPYRYYTNSSYGFIGDVYTIPSERQKGLITKLTEVAMEYFRNEGIKTIRLLASKEAKSLYKKIGFKLSDEMTINL